MQTTIGRVIRKPIKLSHERSGQFAISCIPNELIETIARVRTRTIIRFPIRIVSYYLPLVSFLFNGFVRPYFHWKSAELQTALSLHIHPIVF